MTTQGSNNRTDEIVKLPNSKRLLGILQTDMKSANFSNNNSPSKRAISDETSPITGENNFENKNKKIKLSQDIPSHNPKVRKSKSTRLTESQINKIRQFITMKSPAQVTGRSREKEGESDRVKDGGGRGSKVCLLYTSPSPRDS